MIVRRLGPILRHGSWSVAAVEETALSATGDAGFISGTGTKRPVALLFAGPDGVRVLSPQGLPLPTEERSGDTEALVAEFRDAVSRNSP
jgi:hypothetical protein